MRKHKKRTIREISVLRPSEWVDLMWELLVAYANEDLRVPRGWTKFNWTELVPAYESPSDRIVRLLFASGIVWGFPQIPPDFDPNEPGDPADSTDRIFRRTSKQLKRHHEMFKKLLTWICAPKKGTPPDIREMRKLASRPGPLILVPGRYPMISAEDEHFVDYLEKYGLPDRRVAVHEEFSTDRHVVLYSSWRGTDAIDPFCAFLLERCSGKLPTLLPVKLCARRECGRFFLPARNTGKFCSDSCRSRQFWTPQKRREYMREYRLKRLSPGARRRKLKIGARLVSSVG